MENLASSLYFLLAEVVLLLVVPLLLLVLVSSLKFRETTRKDQLRLPPGPWRLPVIGSLHHLVRNPLTHRAMADLARRWNAPVMYLRLGELHTVVVSSPDAAREVMKTHDVLFASRPLSSAAIRASIEDGLGVAFSPYGERWRQLRKACTQELLTTSQVRSFRPLREQEAACLVRDIAACPPGERVNVSARVSRLVADVALCAMLGEHFKRREEFLEVVHEMVKISDGFHLGDLYPSSRFLCAVDGTMRKARASHRKLYQLVDYAIEQYRERKAGVASMADAPDDNFIGVLLRIQKEQGALDGSIDMGALKAVIVDLFIAGGETTSTTINWAMAELMRNPNVMQKAQAELHRALQGKSRVTEADLASTHYLKLIIKETMRCHPAGPLLLPRECRESCKILGYDVPEGTMVLVNTWAISMDPKCWDEPELFKPERFEGNTTTDFRGTDFRYTPFGAGRRMCPGVGFAMPIVELVLATLLFHFDWQLPPGVVPNELDMSEEVGITMSRKNDLYLHPTVRVPLRGTA